MDTGEGIIDGIEESSVKTKNKLAEDLKKLTEKVYEKLADPEMRENNTILGNEPNITENPATLVADELYKKLG